MNTTGVSCGWSPQTNSNSAPPFNRGMPRVKETPPAPQPAGGRLTARGRYHTMKFVLAEVLARVGFSP